MSIFGWFTRQGDKDMNAELERARSELQQANRQNLQIVQSAARVTKRRSEVMHTMAGAMQMMARGDNEDH